MTEDDRPDSGPDETEPTAGIPRPAEPPAYPGYGMPGWYGSGGRPAPGSPPQPPHQQPAGYPSPYGPSPYPHDQHRRHTPWVAIVAVTAAVGLVSGVLAAVGVIAADRLDDPASSTSQIEPLEEDTAPLPSRNASVPRVADTVLPSVVQIQVRSGATGATGSGFVLDDEGRIVTNSHVVDAADADGRISVVLPNGSQHPAELIGQSPAYDLAVVQVTTEGLRPARLGSSGRLLVGQQVIAFGSPLGLTSTVTSGIVSALDRPVTAGGGDQSSFINAIQTDAAINPGNSGGPLVDLQGRVIGVNSAIATVSSSLGGEAGNIGVGFAIPIDQVRLTAEQIIETGKAVYPVIGATINTEEGKPAVVKTITANSPAEDAGLQEGDVLRSIDGEPVRDGIELIVSIRSHRPGDTIEIGYERDGDERSTEVVLGEQEG